MLRTGVDLIEIARVNDSIARFGNRILQRVFTPAEREICNLRAESLAGRFAAKEAVAKALGTGIWREGVAWTDIETLRAENGEPLLRLHGAAARRAAALQITQWSLSITHDRTRAIAFVVGLGA